MTEEVQKSPAIRLIIAGSKHFTDYNLIENKLLELGVEQQSCTVITGMSYGVDRMGFDFARKFGKDTYIYPARWEIHGSDAESVRNELMAKAATHCIVIWDGKSKGSANMIKLAKHYNLKLIEIIL